MKVAGRSERTRKLGRRRPLPGTLKPLRGRWGLQAWTLSLGAGQRELRRSNSQLSPGCPPSCSFSSRLPGPSMRSRVGGAWRTLGALSPSQAGAGSLWIEDGQRGTRDSARDRSSNALPPLRPHPRYRGSPSEEPSPPPGSLAGFRARSERPHRDARPSQSHPAGGLSPKAPIQAGAGTEASAPGPGSLRGWVPGVAPLRG